MNGWGDVYDVAIESSLSDGRWTSKAIYETKLGAAFCGDSLKILQSKRLHKHKGTVQLVFTSPPFPLNTKKKYGNLQGEQYLGIIETMWQLGHSTPLAYCSLQ